MGIGLILVKRQLNLTRLFPPFLLLLIGSCSYFSNILVSGLTQEESFFATYFDLSPNSKEMGMVPVVSIIFILSALPFIALGNAMGREFKHFSSLYAYGLNTAGSLAGLMAFSILSFYSIPPLVWFGLGSIIFIFLSSKEKSNILSFAILGLTLFLVQSLYHKDSEIWSPYYKINYFQKLHNYVLDSN